jgi:hypothetical protein
MTIDERRLLAPRVYGKNGLVVASSDDIHVVNTDRFEIRTLAVDGTLRHVLRLTGGPTPVTQADIDRYREYALGREPRESRHPRIRREIAAMPFPEAQPFVLRLYVDRVDRLWVEDFRPPWETQSHFSVFTASGAFAGRVRLPDGELLLEVGPDFLLTRRLDEVGVHYVRLYELPFP